MLDELRPFFRGEWTSYGESLQLVERASASRSIASWLNDAEYLEKALARHAASLGSAEATKAVASDWTLRYFSALLPPLVALLTLRKQAPPTGWQDMEVIWSDDALPARFLLRRLGSVHHESDASSRYETLVWQHLVPFIARIGDHTRVPAKILRGNLHRVFTSIFAHAAGLVSHDARLVAAVTSDRDELLGSPRWCGRRRNPLFLPTRQVLANPEHGQRLLTLHAGCCLAYQLPHGEYCDVCPLAPKYRVRRPRRTAPATAPPDPLAT